MMKLDLLLFVLKTGNLFVEKIFAIIAVIVYTATKVMNALMVGSIFG